MSSTTEPVDVYCLGTAKLATNTTVKSVMLMLATISQRALRTARNCLKLMLRLLYEWG